MFSFGTVGNEQQVFDERIQPGDVIKFMMSDEVFHMGVAVAPGLIFEKTDPFSSSFFRLITIQSASEQFGASSIEVLRLKENAKLPEPINFANALPGGNTVAYSDGSYSVINTLPPIADNDKDGIWSLDTSAYDADSYGFKDIPNRPLKKIEGPWFEFLEGEECTTTRDVMAELHPWYKPFPLGLVAKGTTFTAVEQTLDFKQAAVVETVDGEFLSGRGLRKPWFPVDSLECKKK